MPLFPLRDASGNGLLPQWIELGGRSECGLDHILWSSLRISSVPFMATVNACRRPLAKSERRFDL